MDETQEYEEMVFSEYLKNEIPNDGEWRKYNIIALIKIDVENEDVYVNIEKMEEIEGE